MIKAIQEVFFCAQVLICHFEQTFVILSKLVFIDIKENNLNKGSCD